MGHNEAYKEAERLIDNAYQSGAIELYLNDLELEELPDSIGQLVNLEILDIRYHQLTKLPDSIGKLVNLQFLKVECYELIELPNSIGQLVNLEILDLQDNPIIELPDSIGELINLKTLNLRGDHLTELPDFIGQLVNLKELDLRDNQLIELPDFIGQLVNLKTLDLRDNHLTELPDFIGQLVNLKTLDLGANRLAKLPDSIGHLKKLRSLCFNDNELTELPDFIRHLVDLQSLDLGANHLTELPDFIGGIKNLQILNFSGNKLTELPDTMGKLKALKELYINNNPLPPEIVAAYEEGIGTLKTFFQSKLAESLPLYEAKLILVGEGEVGKTCLLDALENKEWKEHDSTHGIEIRKVEVNSTKFSKKIILNAWDFGGQRVYRPTHQLFFSAPAVYLVIWKPREGPQQGFVTEWIRLIKHREPAAKILIVATHGGPQQRQPDINRQEIMDSFGKETVLDFFFVDSKPDGNGYRWGIKELKEAIGKVAEELPEMGRRIPKSWKEVYMQMLDTGKAFLTKLQVIEFCKKKKIPKEETEAFIAIFHRLGHFIHYGYDLTLKDIIILKPDWLASAISLVLDDEATRKAQGLATFEHLNYVWHNPKRPANLRYPIDLHRIFIRLMERFDLSYQVVTQPKKEETDFTHLIGQLVLDYRPTEQLAKKWPAALTIGDTQQVQICKIVDAKTKESAKAEGLFFQLIVRLHKFSLGRYNYPDSIHWQKGLLLDNDYNGRALLEHKGNNIHITVRAPFPDRFLTMLTEEIKYLVESFWEGLDCQVMVPCITPCGKESPGLGQFEVEKLIDSKKKQRPDYPCPICHEWQNIDGLLRNATAIQSTANLDIINRIDSVKQDLKAVSKQLATNTQQTMGRFDSLDKGQKQVISKVDGMFAGLLKTYTDEAKEGPRLFSFEPIDRTKFNPKEWTSSKFRLTFWCEHSRLPVSAHNGKDSHLGIYEVELTRQWLKKSAPYLKFLQGTLSLVLPVALSGLELGFDDASFEVIEEELNFGKEVIDASMKGGEAIGNWMGGKDYDLRGRKSLTAHGSTLRELHLILKSIDSTYSNLGLQRVLNNHQEFMWVHPKFISEY